VLVDDRTLLMKISYKRPFFQNQALNIYLNVLQHERAVYANKTLATLAKSFAYAYLIPAF